MNQDEEKLVFWAIIAAVAVVAYSRFNKALPVITDIPADERALVQWFEAEE